MDPLLPLYLSIAAVALSFVMLVILLIVLFRVSRSDMGAVVPEFTKLNSLQERLERTTREELTNIRGETGTHAQKAREEQSQSFARLANDLQERQVQLNQNQLERIDQTSQQIALLLQNNEQHFEALRTSLAEAQANFLNSMVTQIGQLAGSSGERLEALRGTVEGQLRQIQQDNAAQLEKMRATVDEKLQGTLEKRLGESFKLVSERLETVQRGLGEMQKLATDVGSLQKVLTNVKTRGGWGEVQLGALLEQVLQAGQYERNVQVKPDSGERVEFAIKLPGGSDETAGPLWLPIDAKFPVEDYQRLQEALEKSTVDEIQAAGQALEASFAKAAAEISKKYLAPPHTTDFGIMFLPTEGLYAELIRRPGLVEKIQREFRVVVAGPTTLAALLNSLQMGFRTLAIQQRSSEVWNVLSGVKAEFGKFGEAIEGVRKKLQEAQNKVEEVTVRSRAVTRKLRDVQDTGPVANGGGSLSPGERVLPLDEPGAGEASS